MTDNATPEAKTPLLPAKVQKPKPAPAAKKRRSFAAELDAVERRILLALCLMEAAEATEAPEAKLALYRVAKEKLEGGK